MRAAAVGALNRHSGAKVLNAFKYVIDNDPDSNTRRRAISGLHQMPDGEGIPLLIQLAKTTKDNEVRKQTMSLLGQSHDGRAQAFFEEVLKK